MGEGKLTQIIGAVLDIRFEKEELPALYNAIHIPYQDSYVVAEVMQHLGNDTVRCVAMSATEGLQRGMKAIDTGAPIKVPVGKEVLGVFINKNNIQLPAPINLKLHCPISDVQIESFNGINTVPIKQNKNNIGNCIFNDF